MRVARGIWGTRRQQTLGPWILGGPVRGMRGAEMAVGQVGSDDLVDERDLTRRLLLAVIASEQPLSLQEIDQILCVAADPQPVLGN